MNEQNYFQKNLETGKLNVHTTKEFYGALESEQKKVFKNYCLWSRGQNCWVSKGKADHCHYLKDQLTEMGFTQLLPAGKRIAFEEKIEREKARAEQRLENAERNAGKAAQRSDNLYKMAKDMASVIPFGQPIHIGHHSEKRDRNYRAKISNKFEQAFKEADKVEHYENKAADARYTASGAKYSDPKYLLNRIKESEKNIRADRLRLEGRSNSRPHVVPLNETQKAFYDQRIAEETEKLAYYQKCMKAIKPDWDPAAKLPTGKRNRKGI